MLLLCENTDALRNKVEPVNPEIARQARIKAGLPVSTAPLTQKALSTLSPDTAIRQSSRAKSRISQNSQNSYLTADFMVGIPTPSDYAGSQLRYKAPSSRRSASPFQVPPDKPKEAENPLAPMVEAEKRKFEAHPEWLTMDRSQFNVEIMPQLKASVREAAEVRWLNDSQQIFIEEALKAYRSELMSKQ